MPADGRIGWRSWPAHLIFTLVLVTLTGCSSVSNQVPRMPTGTATQELKVGFGADPYVSASPGGTLGMYPLNSNIFETLVYLSPDYEVVPRLAERWEFRPPNTWRFFLHRSVRFQDGRPLDAEAVKAGLFDRVAKLPEGATIKAGPNSAAVVDSHIIDFTPMEPDFRVPQQIANPQFGVVAPGSNGRIRPIGTGPFRFVEYRPGDRLVVEGNRQYWGAIRPSVSRIVFRFYPDSVLRAKALESGEIAFAYEVRRQDVEELRQKDLQVLIPPVGGSATLLARIGGQPPHDLLSDVTVRKAIGYAVDRRTAVKDVFHGLAEAQQSFIPPLAVAPYGGEVKGYYFSREEANSLLADIGWAAGPDGILQKEGRRLELTLVSGFPNSQAQEGLASFLRDALRKVGIDLVVVGAPDANTYRALLTAGQGDLFLEQRYQEDGNPLSLAMPFFGESSGSHSYQALFAPGGRFDAVIASALQEPDTDKVRRAASDAVHELVDEQAVVLPLAGIFDIYAMSSSVQGLVAHPSSLELEWNGVVLL